MFAWPDAGTVDHAVRQWAVRIRATRSGVRRIGYFGSYARGDWGVGSDLDLVVVVERSTQPFDRRRIDWDLTELPVPVDVLVYTEDEWQALDRGSRFGRMLEQETVWV